MASASATVSACGIGPATTPPVELADREHLTSALNQVLPGVERQHVTLWQELPCRALESSSGAYRDPPPAFGCGFASEPVPFDAGAEAVFGSIASSFDRAGVPRPESGWFAYEGNGALSSAIFSYGRADRDGCFEIDLTWRRSPDMLAEPDEPGETSVPIDPGWTWHEVLCDT